MLTPVKYDRRDICIRILLSSEIIIDDVGGVIHVKYIQLVRNQYVHELVNYCLYNTGIEVRIKVKDTVRIPHCKLVETYGIAYNQCVNNHSKCTDDKLIRILIQSECDKIFAIIDLPGYRNTDYEEYDFEYKDIFDSLVIMADYCKFYRYMYCENGYDHGDLLFFAHIKLNAIIVNILMAPVKHDVSIIARILLSSEINIADIGALIRVILIQILRRQHLRELFQSCLYFNKSEIVAQIKPINISKIQNNQLLNQYRKIYDYCKNNHGGCYVDGANNIDIIVRNRLDKFVSYIDLTGCKHCPEHMLIFTYAQILDTLIAIADYCTLYRIYYKGSGELFEELIQ